jgi:hypothetical protein
MFSAGKSVAEVPVQLAIWNNPAPDRRFLESGPVSLLELAPVGASCAVATLASSPHWEHHGRVGQVVGHEEELALVRLPKLPQEPAFGHGIAAAVADKFFPAGSVARTLGMRPDILGRIVGYDPSHTPFIVVF